MKKTLALLSICAMCLATVVPAIAQTSDDGKKLSGEHVNLNLIGVKEKINDTISGGSRIFVNLQGKTTINLSETTPFTIEEFGDGFYVIDGNGTDSNGATFQLPNPDVTNSGTTIYSVFAKVLGQKGDATMTTGAYYNDDGELLKKMSVISAEFDSNGKPSFTNVTKELLYIYVDLDGNGTAERYNIFNDALQDYFWEYDNNGLKHVQLRFYPISTTVPDSYPVPTE